MPLGIEASVCCENASCWPAPFHSPCLPLGATTRTASTSRRKTSPCPTTRRAHGHVPSPMAKRLFPRPGGACPGMRARSPAPAPPPPSLPWHPPRPAPRPATRAFPGGRNFPERQGPRSRSTSGSAGAPPLDHYRQSVVGPTPPRACVRVRVGYVGAGALCDRGLRLSQGLVHPADRLRQAPGIANKTKHRNRKHPGPMPRRDRSLTDRPHRLPSPLAA